MAITPFGMPGIMEMLLVAILGSGVGIPLGVPPQKPDPMMAKIAPDKCLYYTTWAGMAKLDPASPNQTEQLFAEPEVQVLFNEVERAIKVAVDRMVAGAPQEVVAVYGNAPTLAKTLLTHPTAVFVERAVPGPQGDFDVKGALIVNLGDDADEIGDMVEQILDIVPAEFATKVTIEGVECIELRSDPSVPVFTVGSKDGYLVIAVGQGSFKELILRMTTPPPQWLTQAMASLTVPRVASFAYADVESLLKLAAQFGGPETRAGLDALGLSSVTTAVSVSGLDETGFVSRVKINSTEPNKGLGVLLGAKPLTAKDLAAIPQDASIAFALRMDLEQAVNHTIESLAEVDPAAAESAQSFLDMLDLPLGVKLKDDLLGSLGDVWTLHAAPSGGGLAAGWTLAVDLQDAKKMREVHKNLLGRVRVALAPGMGALRIREFEHHGQTAYMLEIPDDDFFVAPTWCLTDTHLVVTLLPQTMKSFLNHIQGQTSLADVPVVANLLDRDKAPGALAYQDVRGQFVTFYPLLQYGVQTVASQMQVAGIDIDTTALPSIPAVAPHLLPKVSTVCKTDDGFEAYTHTTLPGANMGAAVPVLVALVLPAVQSARQSARRAQASNNMKQIALAIHNYHDAFKAMPAAYNADENGKPLLSWRVHILPFIEQQALYEQFHLDEPWSSKHNRKLIARMPAIYQSPGSMADPGKTVYLGNAGEGGIFVSPKENGKQGRWPLGTRFRDITDGLSQTIMLVEAGDTAAVIWTKPDDFALDKDNPLRGLIGRRPGIFMTGFCDGSVQALSTAVNRDTLKGLFTRAGGENVDGF